MSIRVVCTACHASFNVSDKFAGKTGPCPKCKKTIQVPNKSEEVTVHERTSEEGAKDSKGRSVLKPILRSEAKFNPIIAGISGFVALLILILAFVLGDGDNTKMALMAIGAIAIAPPLIYLGYAALRDSELEAFTGLALWGRIAGVTVVYAGIWAGFAYLGPEYLTEIWLKIGFLAFASVVGSLAALVAFELDFGNAFFHYLFYLAICIILRLALGLEYL